MMQLLLAKNSPANSSLEDGRNLIGKRIGQALLQEMLTFFRFP